MTKSRGPRTDPWGTPQEEVWKEERLSSHSTQKKRDDMMTITKFKPQVVFQYGFRSFLQHRNTVNRLVQ